MKDWFELFNVNLDKGLSDSFLIWWLIIVFLLVFIDKVCVFGVWLMRKFKLGWCGFGVLWLIRFVLLMMLICCWLLYGILIVLFLFCLLIWDIGFGINVVDGCCGWFVLGFCEDVLLGDLCLECL